MLFSPPFKRHSQLNTMNLVILLISVIYLLPVRPEDLDPYSYCESCLTAAQEIDKAMKEVSAESRQSAVKKLLGWQLCEKPQMNERGGISKHKMKSACVHLLDSHRDQFRAALLNKEQKNLSILLCYELSRACVGVKRHAFQEAKATFTEADIEALLRDNKEQVRTARPVHASGRDRDEL